MHLAYYITGHGYGHAIRSVTIAQMFSPSTVITFKTTVPLSFFRDELKRPFHYKHSDFDCGCIQFDSVSVDIHATFQKYRQIAERNRFHLDGEVEWCRKNRISGIISDIVPFAFEIAHYAGIPALAVTNFTWYDIYREYIPIVPEFSPFLEEMLLQYGFSTKLLALAPSLSMNYFKKQQPIPVVGRKGVNRREIYHNRYGYAREKKIALIYIGDFGLPSARWSQLESFSSWEFFGLQDIPGQPANYHVIDKTTLFYPDLIASCDCVVSKLGYGVVAECMINGTPLVFLPRYQFAEYPVLEKAILTWRGGVQLSKDKFLNLEWGDALEQAITLKPLPAIPTDGASVCARTIESFF